MTLATTTTTTHIKRALNVNCVLLFIRVIGGFLPPFQKRTDETWLPERKEKRRLTTRDERKKELPISRFIWSIAAILDRAIERAIDRSTVGRNGGQSIILLAAAPSRTCTNALATIPLPRRSFLPPTLPLLEVDICCSSYFRATF